MTFKDNVLTYIKCILSMVITNHRLYNFTFYKVVFILLSFSNVRLCREILIFMSGIPAQMHVHYKNIFLI